MSLPDNALPLVGNLDKTRCYLVNYTPINNNVSNNNNKWLASVLCYNKSTIPNSSDGGNRIYYWSQVMYCSLFGLKNCECTTNASTVPCQSTSKGCLFYSPSSTKCDDDQDNITLVVDGTTDMITGVVPTTSLNLQIVPVFVKVAYSNTTTVLSYNNKGITLYLTTDDNGQIIDSTIDTPLLTSSKSYKLSNSALWASVPLNFRVRSNTAMAGLGEYANGCDVNNLEYFDYSDSIKYGPNGTKSKEDYLGDIYLYPGSFLTKCDTDSPSIITDKANIVQSFNDLELYVTGEINNVQTARWASPDSCNSGVRFLYCGLNQDCGDIATDQSGINGPCNGFCTIPPGGSSACTITTLTNGGYNVMCLETLPPTPWYKQSTMLGLIAGFAGLLIIGIIAIIIYIHKSHEDSEDLNQ